MIETQGLAFQYPGSSRLVFPDVRVAQGEVLLLGGPSGCGKSTWLALVAGLVAPCAGVIHVVKQNLGDLNSVATDAWRARTIGFLPQKLHLSAALTVHQNLALAQWAAGQPEDSVAIHASLQFMGIEDLSRRLPAQLSGGQAQRVALARAVLLKPHVLLADEPTASLDDEAANAAVALLMSTARNHDTTLVIATHDARVAAMLPKQVNGQNSFHSLQLLRQQRTNRDLTG